MAVGKKREERIREYRDFVNLLKERLGEFKAPIVLQLNFGCPNTENPLETLRDEIIECLKIARKTGLPLMTNFNPLVPAQLLLELEQSGLVDCHWVANSLPYGIDHLGERIFGEDISPMWQRGFGVDGGISGPQCLDYTIRTVRAAREELGVTLPIVAGNGVQSIGAVKALKEAGADGVEIATAAILRPKCVPAVVKFANQIFAKGAPDVSNPTAV